MIVNKQTWFFLSHTFSIYGLVMLTIQVPHCCDLLILFERSVLFQALPLPSERCSVVNSFMQGVSARERVSGKILQHHRWTHCSCWRNCTPEKTPMTFSNIYKTPSNLHFSEFRRKEPVCHTPLKLARSAVCHLGAQWRRQWDLSAWLRLSVNSLGRVTPSLGLPLPSQSIPFQFNSIDLQRN